MARKKQILSERDELKQFIIKCMKPHGFATHATFVYSGIELRMYFSYKKSDTYGKRTLFNIRLPYSGCEQLLSYKIVKFRGKPDEIDWFTFVLGEDKVIADKTKQEADYICDVYNICLEALDIDCLVSHRVKNSVRGFVFTRKSSGKSRFVGDRPKCEELAKIK